MTVSRQFTFKFDISEGEHPAAVPGDRPGLFHPHVHLLHPQHHQQHAAILKARDLSNILDN